jgi:hypothetical protein
VRLEVGEHVVGERAGVATAGTADADAQSQEVLGLQVLRDRAEAVVAAEPAAEAKLETSALEVALVVHDEHGVGIELEEACGGRDRAARLVHVRLGLQQRELVTVEADLRELAGELRAP